MLRAGTYVLECPCRCLRRAAFRHAGRQLEPTTEARGRRRTYVPGDTELLSATREAATTRELVALAVPESGHTPRSPHSGPQPRGRGIKAAAEHDDRFWPWNLHPDLLLNCAVFPS